jgi:hypothetical protein
MWGVVGVCFGDEVEFERRFEVVGGREASGRLERGLLEMKRCWIKL